MPPGTPRAARAEAVRTLRLHAAGRLSARPCRSWRAPGEFLAADIAVMIGVEPVEHMLAHLIAAALAPRARFVRR